MITWRIARAAGLACALVGFSVEPSRAQAVPAADAALQKHQLKRSGATYILSDEATVTKGMKELGTLYRKLAEGLHYLDRIDAGAAQRKTDIAELSQNNLELQSQVQAISERLAMIEQTGVNNPVMNAQRNQTLAQRDSVVAAANQVIERLNTLRKMEYESDGKRQVQAEVSQRREQFVEAMLGLRGLVDATVAKYQALAENEEVLHALSDATAGSKSKIRYKLGPSRDFLAAVQRLEKAEASVSSDFVACRREGGVFVVDAMLNGKLAVPMIYDTGASEVILSSELADELGMKPSDSDPVVKHRIADGSIVEARRMTLASVRVGKVTVKDVVCSVMPGSRDEITPLLGQAFLSQVDHKMSGDGRLFVAKVEQGEAAARTGRANRPTRAAAGSRRRRAPSRKAPAPPRPDLGADFPDPE